MGDNRNRVSSNDLDICLFIGRSQHTARSREDETRNGQGNTS